MGPGIVIPLAVLAVVVPVALTWARKNLKEGARHQVPDDTGVGTTARLTSAALRDLPSPPWRVVYEIADDKLGGVGHVLVGPAGVFAIRTSMEPLPTVADAPDAPDARAVAAAAIVRTQLDDALRRCAMASDRLVTVHWGARSDGGPDTVDPIPGETAVDGRTLVAWAQRQQGALTPAQVDLAWQTVLTAIGRPDPLA